MPLRGAWRLGALLLAAQLTLVGCSGDTSIPPPVSSGDAASARSAAATRTVAALDAALRDGDSEAAAALGLGGARALLQDAVANVRTLDLVDLSLRYVDDRSLISGGDGSTTGAWRATVAVLYRLGGWDTAVTELETTFLFSPGEDGQLISGIGDADGRTPLWLTGPVTAQAAGRTLVVARGTAGYSAQARRAVADVGRVLPRWSGPLIIEVPGTETELDRVLGAAQGRYANIAAVTASVDGSQKRTAPVHVFLNPRVFEALGSRGAQVVMTHEATHVATAATFTTMPVWLLEGFADYVALANAGITVEVAAAQILKEISRTGRPQRLPTAEDLAPDAAGLGATYEEAWLATRFIAEVYGEQRLVAFYRAVDRGQKTEDAFRDVLGTTEASYVKRWSADAVALAAGARVGVAG